MNWRRKIAGVTPVHHTTYIRRRFDSHRTHATPITDIKPPPNPWGYSIILILSPSSFSTLHFSWLPGEWGWGLGPGIISHFPSITLDPPMGYKSGLRNRTWHLGISAHPQSRVAVFASIGHTVCTDHDSRWFGDARVVLRMALRDGMLCKMPVLMCFIHTGS